MLQCDKCKKHAPIDGDSDGGPPTGWTFIRFGEFDSEEPIDCSLCEDCRADFLSSIGFSSPSEYLAVLKANKNNPSADKLHKVGTLLRYVLNGAKSPFKNELDLN